MLFLCYNCIDLKTLRSNIMSKINNVKCYDDKKTINWFPGHIDF